MAASGRYQVPRSSQNGRHLTQSPPNRWKPIGQTIEEEEIVITDQDLEEPMFPEEN